MQLVVAQEAMSKTFPFSLYTTENVVTAKQLNFYSQYFASHPVPASFNSACLVLYQQ